MIHARDSGGGKSSIRANSTDPRAKRPLFAPRRHHPARRLPPHPLEQRGVGYGLWPRGRRALGHVAHLEEGVNKGVSEQQSRLP